MTRHFLASITLAALLLGLAGRMQRRVEKEQTPFERPPIDGHLSIIIDLSGSFRTHLARDGRAFGHLMQVVQAYFQAGAGQGRHDRLLLAQISGSRETILFEGTPREFQEAYASPDDLRRQALARSDPSGSRVHDTIADTVQHVLGSDGVRPGKTRLALLVLSDMEDTAGTAGTPERLARGLQDFARAGGVIGLHWLPQSGVQPWRAFLTRCGFAPGRACVTADFHPSAPLPKF